MPKKKTDEVVEQVKIQAPTEIKEVKTEIKPEIKDKNNVTFVKPSYANAPSHKVTDARVASDGQASIPTITQPTPMNRSSYATASEGHASNSVQIPRPMPTQMPPRPVVVNTQNQNVELISGILEIMPDNQGFVRPNFIPNGKDAFIGSMQVRRYGLRAGDFIVGAAKAPKDGEKYWAIVRIDSVNEGPLTAALNRPDFKDLVPVYPEKQMMLETDAGILSTRIMDLFCPVGFGQRGMVVSPPKAGKTSLLKEIAAGVAINYPKAHLMAVLVGERPEEVTDMQRFIKGEVVASSFDQKPEEQTRAAEIAMERAKRLVELGRDVVIVFDSITRLARAYNLAIPTSGRTLSGGFDPAALYPSKKFFGAARKIEGGGSLTIIGTSLVDTGSKMDDLIFEEFKGTGNMELRLERNLAERRIFPAFDILKSGTRKEELLLDPTVMTKVISMRRMFDAMGDNNNATEMIIEQMNKTKNNDEFMAKIGSPAYKTTADRGKK